MLIIIVMMMMIIMIMMVASLTRTHQVELHLWCLTQFASLMQNGDDDHHDFHLGSHDYHELTMSLMIVTFENKTCRH